MESRFSANFIVDAWKKTPLEAAFDEFKLAALVKVLPHTNIHYFDIERLLSCFVQEHIRLDLFASILTSGCICEDGKMPSLQLDEIFEKFKSGAARVRVLEMSEKLLLARVWDGKYTVVNIMSKMPDDDSKVAALVIIYRHMKYKDWLKFTSTIQSEQPTIAACLEAALAIQQPATSHQPITASENKPAQKPIKELLCEMFGTAKMDPKLDKCKKSIIISFLELVVEFRPEEISGILACVVRDKYRLEIFEKLSKYLGSAKSVDNLVAILDKFKDESVRSEALDEIDDNFSSSQIWSYEVAKEIIKRFPTKTTDALAIVCEYMISNECDKLMAELKVTHPKAVADTLAALTSVE